MGRSKLELKYREDARARRSTYASRVKSMKKQSGELTSLCGVDVLFVSFSPELNQYHSFPEQDSAEFQRISQRFLGSRAILKDDFGEKKALDLKLKEVRERIGFLEANGHAAAAAAADLTISSSSPQHMPPDTAAPASSPEESDILSPGSFNINSPVSVLPFSTQQQQEPCNASSPLKHLPSPPAQSHPLSSSAAGNVVFDPLFSVDDFSVHDDAILPNASSSPPQNHLLSSSAAANIAAHTPALDHSLFSHANPVVDDESSSLMHEDTVFSASPLWSPMRNWNDFSFISY